MQRFDEVTATFWGDGDHGVTTTTATPSANSMAPQSTTMSAEDPVSSSLAPSPHEVAAWFALGRVSARTPWWAAQWLAAGHDGEALREMAGLNGRDTRDLHDLLPSVLTEMGIHSLPEAFEAVTTVFRNIAAECLAGRLDERAVAQEVEEIVISHDYASEIIDLPLGQLYGLDDEWHGGWGATVEQLRATVRARCADQLVQPPT